MNGTEASAQLKQLMKPYYYQKELGQNISRNVAARRKQLGLTQQDLAQITRKKQPHIARLERKSYASHTISSLCKIAVALDTTVEALLSPEPTKGGNDGPHEI